jgi:hypothetical protein
MMKNLRVVSDNEKQELGAGFLVKRELVEFAETTTFHGVYPVYRSDHIVRKLAWLALILASSSYCFYCKFHM